MRSFDALSDHTVLAWRSINATRARTSLAVLGVLIGVAAIVLVFALGAAAQAEMDKSVNALGSNMVMVFPTADADRQPHQRRGRLTEADAKAIASSTTSVRAVAPQLRLSTRLASQGRYADVTVVGVDSGYFDISRPTFEQGRAFDTYEAQSRVAILGSAVAKKLFGDTSSVGRTVRIGKTEFRVVGVFSSSGGSVLGDRENFVLTPIAVARHRLIRAGATAPDAVDLLFAQYEADQPLAKARGEVIDLLRKRYRVRDGDPDPFTVDTTEEFAKHSESIVGVLRLTLGSVASISLLVGGIGIMNIMLVSVTERTREIGVRLAVGARPAQIRMQFLIESGLICLLGGAAGSALAFAIAATGSAISGWSITVSPQVLLLALGFSAGIGVLAGFLPAARASRLDPIEALRRD